MSLSTNIYGVILPDDEYRRNYEAWRACRAVGVHPPESVYCRLGVSPGEQPNESGALVRLEVIKPTPDTRGCEEWFEVDLAALPPGVTLIRVVHSY